MGDNNTYKLPRVISFDIKWINKIICGCDFTYLIS